MGAVGVVVELDLERQQAVFAEVHRLDRFSFLEVPDVQAAPVLEVTDLFEIEARHERVRCGPLGADHHVVTWLVPEVVAERDVAHRVLPPADDLEVLVDVEVAARCLARGVAEEGDDDLRAEAVHGVGSGQVRFRLDLVAVDHGVQPWGPRVGGGVDDVDVVGPHARKQQVLAAHRRVVVARRARVPAGVVELVADTRHLQPMDDLGIGGALGIGIDRGEVVGLLNPGAGIQRNGVQEVLAGAAIASAGLAYPGPQHDPSGSVFIHEPPCPAEECYHRSRHRVSQSENAQEDRP